MRRVLLCAAFCYALPFVMRCVLLCAAFYYALPFVMRCVLLCAAFYYALYVFKVQIMMSKYQNNISCISECQTVASLFVMILIAIYSIYTGYL